MDLYVVSVLCFGLGYVLGRLDCVVRHLRNSADPTTGPHAENLKTSWTTATLPARSKVKIDDTKFVTDISTSGMQNSGKELGTITETHDNVSAAANRLAQLKKMKG